MVNIVEQIMSFKPFDIPVGSGLLLTAAFGLSDGLVTLVDQLSRGLVPPALTPVTVAAIINNVKPVKNFMGPDLAELVSVAALTSAINSQINMTGRIRGLVNQLTNLIPGVRPAPAAIAPAPATEAMSGYPMGSPTRAMGQVSEATNVDDVDMLLLQARGYQTA